jgi:hypothetical protein
LLACILAASGCGSAKIRARYDGGAGAKTNSAGTLSAAFPPALPLDIPEIEQSRAGGGETGAPGGEAAAKRAVLSSKDIVEIKEKMFIAQTNDVYLNSEDYIGKTIKLEGLFKTELPYEDRAPYCFVLRYGPGCCGYDGNAGFEVAWDGAEAEAAYPAEDEWVEAQGVLKTYLEDGYPYLYLALSSLRVLDERGAEFVTQ